MGWVRRLLRAGSISRARLLGLQWRSPDSLLCFILCTRCPTKSACRRFRGRIKLWALSSYVPFLFECIYLLMLKTDNPLPLPRHPLPHPHPLHVSHPPPRLALRHRVPTSQWPQHRRLPRRLRPHVTSRMGTFQVRLRIWWSHGARHDDLGARLLC